jgi:hypothetical protein
MFSKTLDREHENDAPLNLTPWYMQHPPKPHYKSRLTKVPCAVNNIIRPPTNVETVNNSATSPWKNEEIFEIHIPTGTQA